MCKLCGEDCQIWGDFQVSESLDLYEQVALKVNKPLVIDSSKNVDWIRQQVRSIESTSTQPYLIFLRRDGRAVINSRIRKYPKKNAKDLIADWSEQIQLTNALFDAFPHKKLKVSYEEFATNSEAIARQICEFLEVEYEPEMLNYGTHEHHVLGGNNGTQFLVAQAQSEKLKNPFVQVPERSKSFYQNLSGISLDLRWKQELDPSVARLFEEMAGRINQELKWEV
ncbi:MAG: sulfotransferase [Leptolyngbyaceae cyanobacterium SM1_3_5]|nr:sulfotransferase [Leptolyngbyaceae cyanobacterium SM1_3_5]